MRALIKHGYKIPEDIKVAGFDGIDKGAYISPSLSTVFIDWKEYGTRIAKLALEILSNNQAKELVMEVELIERDSTKIM